VHTAPALPGHLLPSPIASILRRRETRSRVSGMAEETHETPADLETIRKQLDHLDGMIHEIHQFIHENKPHLERALTVLDNPVSKYLEARKAARRGGTTVQ